MITALILDFDGLIVDTESPALQSWQIVYAEHGQEIDLEVWQGALGTNHGFDALAHLIGLAEAADPARGEELRARGPEILSRRQQIKAELSAAQPLLPGVTELLDQADAAGLPCAVASSSGRGWVEGWLRRHAIIGRFVCVRTADDVAYTKPAPDLFLAAAAGLGRAPAACLVFEDSPNGILAATAAGCPVVAVPGAVTARLALPPAGLRLPRLDAMPLAEIIAAVA
ncbi:HAD-IA family hydrolase [Oscillochloris sp. ZM17-4]|uniref:HAD-IA family hydrolase n=1 Tax=Oscillochloris sp. ZM17-4 TaxID=2866714 RepID=UPI001C72D8BA|nr:HAD-IA family hydrolase [Oscillochloris sp. ZM17-4]MBX0327414.1 HAD-IA family hydrolase [Oscillochloris sp. ZM17-4]